MTQITIIGAGIGGLSVGLALQKNNIDYQIVEAADELKPVGAGILLGANALKILDQWGILEELAKAGNFLTKLNITDQKLNVLLCNKSKKNALFNLAIHRGDLQQVLLKYTQLEKVKLSKKLSRIKIQNNGFELSFENNTVDIVDKLIAADGVHSVVRKTIFKKNNLQQANQMCWRAVCKFELPDKYQDELNEAWGKGKRFGFVKICTGTIYWYALVNHNLRKDNLNLEAVFSDFDPLILQILKATASAKIYESELIDLEPFSPWAMPNVCLMGDAAHAILPNLGQGAAQAIVDAALLGEYIKTEKSINSAFEKFSQKRTKKLKILAMMSRNMGKMAEIEHPFAIKIRNLFFRMMPNIIAEMQLKYIQD